MDKHSQSAGWCLAPSASEWTMVPALMGLLAWLTVEVEWEDRKEYFDSAPKVKFIEVNLQNLWDSTSNLKNKWIQKNPTNIFY